MRLLSKKFLISIGFERNPRSVSGADSWQGVPVWTSSLFKRVELWGDPPEMYVNQNYDRVIETQEELRDLLK